LFRQYWYQSGINETMRAELADVVSEGIAHLGGLADGDIVMDIGANDGTLLSEYAKQVPGVLVTRVAYEPAENLQPALRRHCDIPLRTYFPETLFSLGASRRSVRLITSIACFYAVDDPVTFVRAVADLLTLDGVWIVQFQDLHQMLGATAFDDVCHEHLFYPSLAAIERLITPFGLVLLDAQHRAINGGSLRLTIGRRGRTVSPCVEVLRAHEAGCEDWETLYEFAERVETVCAQIRTVVAHARRRGQVIDLYGASTKGNTLLQTCGLGPDLIRQAWERSPEKWERHTVTGIPIVSEEAGRNDPPDILLVVIWQFRKAVIQREAAYLDNGGQLLFPLPYVDIVTNKGDHVYQSVRADTNASAAG
jgi:hypothetical protein